MTAERTPVLPPESQGTAPGRARLVGRRILVVGGGQNDHGEPDPPIGNGRAMAVLFAREGAHIAVADRDRASVEATSGWTGAIIALARSGRSCSQVAMFGRLSGDAALWLHG